MNDELRFRSLDAKKKRLDFQHPDLLASKIDWEATTPESYDGAQINHLSFEESFPITDDPFQKYQANLAKYPNTFHPQSRQPDDLHDMPEEEKAP